MQRLILTLFCALSVLAQTRFARFEARTLAADLRGGYQVVPVDVDADGKLDLVALGSGMSDLLWFKAPHWERHVLATGLKRMINTWPMDIDGDRIPEFLVAHAFENEAARSVGIVSLLTRGDDLTKPWNIREIDRLTTSHRIRAANGLFINAPLTGASAVAPEYRDHTPLAAYRPGDWHRQMITSDDEGVVHGIYIHDWNRDGRDDVLTASFRGLHVNLAQRDGSWKREKISDGDPAPWPKSGSSDVAVGSLRGVRFLAAIEPGMAIRPSSTAAHAANGSGASSTTRSPTATPSSPPTSTAMASRKSSQDSAAASGASISTTKRAGRWIRQVLSEGEVSAAACAVADLNGDRKPDIACIGAATQNLILYTQQ
jgi:hypothetical protein